MNDAPNLGKRLAAYRKYLGVSSAKELADLTGNPRITESVVQNIESGRKKDVSVAQLLDLARALRISPIFLLAPIGRPFDLVDVPGVSENVSLMSVHGFESWLTVSEEVVPGESPQQANLRFIYRGVRRLVAAVDEWKKRSTDPTLNVEPQQVEVEPGRVEEYDPRSWAQQALDDSERTVDNLYRQLERFNVDLSWVPRPWKQPADG